MRWDALKPLDNFILPRTKTTKTRPKRAKAQTENKTKVSKMRKAPQAGGGRVTTFPTGVTECVTKIRHSRRKPVPIIFDTIEVVMREYSPTWLSENIQVVAFVTPMQLLFPPAQDVAVYSSQFSCEK